MNNETQELYKELQQDPIRQQTFTAAKMNAIEEKASQLHKGRNGMKKSRRQKIWFVSAASVVSIIIVVLVLQNQDQILPISTPTTTTDQIDQIKDMEPNQDIQVRPKELTGQLGDQLPFNTEKIESITIQSGSDGQESVVPKESEYVIRQNLYWLNMSQARAVNVSANDSIMIRVHMADGVYSIPYDVDSNTYQIGDARFYGDSQVIQFMHGLFRPESKLSLLERISVQAIREADENEAGVDESFIYDGGRFNINGKDVNGWMKQMHEDKGYTSVIHYYDHVIERIDEVRYYEESGILTSGDAIVFMKDTVETTDGIKVGLSKEEVVSLLGKANLELDSEWSYKIGDYLKFHLYFEDNKIIYMRLNLPL